MISPALRLRSISGGLVCCCFFALLAGNAAAQVRGIVLNKQTGGPVAYASIWVENEQLGVSSETDGRFFIGAAPKGEHHLIVSCLGFAKARVAVRDTLVRIELTPVSYLLNEVTLGKAKGEEVAAIGADLSDVEGRWGSLYSVIAARVFDRGTVPDDKPYLKSISLVASSKIAKAHFRLRIFGLGADGAPADDIAEPVDVYVAMGKRTVTVDLSARNLRLPESGFAVGCEFLIVEENKMPYVYRSRPLKKRIKTFTYEPTFGYRSTNDGKNWMYEAGSWKNTTNYENGRTLKMAERIREAIVFRLTVSD